MVIELAGIPLEVRCSHRANERFLQDYQSDRTPEFVIAPTEADLAKIRGGLERMVLKQFGPVPVRPSPVYLENNAIHALLAERLVQYDALLLHGSALCMDGQAVVFTADSGTGKSTHTLLWRKAFGKRVWMINDDKPFIRRCADGFRVFGSPWDGKHHLSRNDSAPLRAVVRLRRAGENRIEPLSRAEAFGELMQHAYRSDSPETMRHVMKLEMALAEAAAFYGLRCNMEPEAALIAKNALFGDDPPRDSV